MTSATSSTAPRGPSNGPDFRLDARVLSQGEWTFTPRPASTPDANAVLCYRGNRIELMYSSTVLEGFLAEMSEIQDEFERLWTGETVAARHTGWVGQSRHV
jgi:hypothetical protein